MPLTQEISYALIGVWRFMRLDRGAMRWFDRSVPGVWRSFLAAAICYPGFLILLWLRLDPAQLAESSAARIFAVETIGYIIGWTAYPLIALPFCRWIAGEEHALGFIAAYNWSQVPQTVLLLIVAGIAAMPGLTPESAAAIETLAYLLLLVYEWFIARIALDRGALPATALVLLDVVLGASLSILTQSLY